MTANDRAFLDSHWPGDAYVGVVGPDWYAQSWPVPAGGWTDALRQSQARPQWRSWLNWTHTFAATHSKPICFPEVGLTIRVDGAGTGDDIYFTEDLLSELAKPDVESVVYFNYQAVDGKHSLTFQPQQFPRAAALLVDRL